VILPGKCERQHKERGQENGISGVKRHLFTVQLGIQRQGNRPASCRLPQEKKCARSHECDHEMFLPVVNSPRAGVCAYSGPIVEQPLPKKLQEYLEARKKKKDG